MGRGRWTTVVYTWKKTKYYGEWTVRSSEKEPPDLSSVRRRVVSGPTTVTSVVRKEGSGQENLCLVTVDDL